MNQLAAVIAVVVVIEAIGIVLHFIGMSLRDRFSRLAGHVVVGISYALSSIAALIAAIVMMGA